MRNSDRMPNLVLASASPRRLELIRRFFPSDRIRVIVPDYDETPLMANRNAVLPETLVSIIAEAKLAALVSQHPLPDLSAAVTADTIVTLNGRVLGKPVSERDAADMLRHLSNQTHSVMTGLSVRMTVDGQSFQQTAVETTTVTFGPLDEPTIKWYLASGEPFDKAGAYGIQGLGAAFISRIDGCYYNVMGLPVYRLFALFKNLAEQTGSHQMRSFFSPSAGQPL